MNEKGFTLVEIMVVIIIVASLLLIITPISLRIIDDVKYDTLETHEKMFVKAAKDYILMYGYEEPTLATTGGTLNVYLELLIDEGLIEGGMKNPVTGSDYNILSYVLVTKLANGNYSYEVILI